MSRPADGLGHLIEMPIQLLLSVRTVHCWLISIDAKLASLID